MMHVLTRIYFAPYHAAKNHLSSCSCGSMIVAFRKAVTRQDWPYDYGDDPSFYAMKKFGGQLSWGVCRQDVRNRLSPGDIVVFFSYSKFRETGDSEYLLCALATVERTVRQTDLWQDVNLRKFKKYFNLLIKPTRPIRGGWVHYEPTLDGDGARVHYDWLWRICDHRGFRKEDIEKLEETNRLKPGAIVRGYPLAVASNYILFSSDSAKTHVLTKPLVVAWHSKGKPAEEWKQDKFSQAVRRMTLDVAA